MLRDPLVRYDGVSCSVTRQGYLYLQHVTIDQGTRRVIVRDLDRYILEGVQTPTAAQALLDASLLLADRMNQTVQLPLL